MNENDTWKNEERLVEEIGRLERQADPDGRWRRRAEGDPRPLGTFGEERLDEEVFRPLGEDFHAEVLKKLGAPASSRPGGKAPRLRPIRRSWLAAAAALVLAAGAAWLLRSAGPVLPAYSAELDGMVREERSGIPDTVLPDGVAVFEVGGPFRLTLRPQEDVQVPLLWVYYLEADGVRTPWQPAEASTSSSGVVRLEGVVGEDVDLPIGDRTLIAVYSTGTPPDADELDAAAGNGWRALRIPLRVLPRPQAALSVEYAGACYTILPGPICVPFAAPYNKLSVWAASANGGLVLTVGGRPADVPGTAVDGTVVDGGVLFTVPVTADGGAVEVRDAAGESWSLGLGNFDQPGWLKDASTRLYYGKTEGLAEELDQRLASLSDPGVRARVHSLLGKVAATEDARRQHLEAAVDGHAQTGQILEMVLDLGQLIHLASRGRRFPEVRRHLQRLASVLDGDEPAEAAFELAYNRGLLASGLGDVRSALHHLHEARTLARRTGLVFQRSIAEEKTALLLQALGRYGDALAVFEDLPPAAGCARVNQLNNHAWALIHARRAGQPAVDPLALLGEARALAAEEGCRERLRLDLRLNQALALLDDGRSFEGLRALQEAEDLAASGSALQHLWAEDLEGRLALDGGRTADAFASFVRMEELAVSAWAPRERWLAQLGQAQAQEALGDDDAALVALERAEALLEERSLQVPLHEGRDIFVAEREAGARRHVELLLRAGRDADALAAARRSRGRVLQGLRGSHRLAALNAGEQARWDAEMASYLALRDALEDEAADDWRLSENELAAVREARDERRGDVLAALDRAFEVLAQGAPASGLPALKADELVLAYHPLPDGWVGFAARDGSLQTHRFTLPGEADMTALAERLLEPFRAEIDAAPRLRILPYGVLRGVDFHALPWDGDVLLAYRPVVYGLDINVSANEDGERRAALVVADPRRDLPAARAEGRAVADVLADASWTVRELNGEAARAAAVRSLAAGVDLLHYAGHGVSNDAAGWQSALQLAGGTRLTLGDVLALERAPRQVVLSSCETARTASAAPLADLGLAQAFLVAGAAEVIAAVREVGDSDTGELFRRLYPADSLAVGLRDAQLAWRDADPGADWASFRVLVP